VAKPQNLPAGRKVFAEYYLIILIGAEYRNNQFNKPWPYQKLNPLRIEYLPSKWEMAGNIRNS
jgi:hypothetical protein